MNLERTDFFRLAGRWLSGIFLSLLSLFPSVGATCVLLCLAFKTVVSFNFKLCVCVYLCIHDTAGTQIPLELKLQGILSHPIWVPGAELRAFARALKAGVSLLPCLTWLLCRH